MMAIIPITDENYLLICNFTTDIHDLMDHRLELHVEPESGDLPPLDYLGKSRTAHPFNREGASLIVCMFVPILNVFCRGRGYLLMNFHQR